MNAVLRKVSHTTIIERYVIELNGKKYIYVQTLNEKNKIVDEVFTTSAGTLIGDEELCDELRKLADQYDDAESATDPLQEAKPNQFPHI